MVCPESMEIGVLKYFLGVSDTKWTHFLMIIFGVQLVSETPKKYFGTPIFIDSGHPIHTALLMQKRCSEMFLGTSPCRLYDLSTDRYNAQGMSTHLM